MLYWIWLTQISGVGPQRQRVLLERFYNPENIYRASLMELLECDGIGNKIAKTIIESKTLEKAKIILDNVNKSNIELLTWDNPLYPDDAKNITEMPILLYYKGNLIKTSMENNHKVPGTTRILSIAAMIVGIVNMIRNIL